MDLFLKARVKNLLKKYQIRPSKKLAQNFLIDKGVLKKVAKTAELSKEDIVLEIGPGLGSLTLELAKRAKKVLAVEKDFRMIEILKEVSKNFKNVKIIPGDILKLERSVFHLNNYKVVSNLPFYLSAPVIRKFLEGVEVKPQQMVLVIQKELGQRICAKPPEMNLLAVSVQFYSQPKIISYIAKESFWPKPKVEAAIIKIIPKRKEEILSQERRGKFFKIARAGFCHPRKQLLNNLAEGLKLNKEETKDWLLKNNIQPERRAETLSLVDLLNLAKSFKIKK